MKSPAPGQKNYENSIISDYSAASNNIFLDPGSSRNTTALNDFTDFDRKLSILKVAENMQNIPLEDMRNNSKMEAMI